MGCNAIRTSHNPPAPELLDLTDRMGFLVVDEIFDVWERKKTPLDSHLIFPDWHERDLRALIRRDRNHPSVILWSFGNEVGVLVPDARNRVRFSLDGPGEIVATDNGDPTSFESFRSSERNAFGGLCLAIVRAKSGQMGPITLKAESECPEEATVALRSEAAQ
jgi:beta-galactosidase/beta-glucuronidase